jgi:hypothetical protein
VLDRIAVGLMLTAQEREHLFMLGLGRPPEIRYHPPTGISPRLQRLLDRLDASPALIKTPTWDIVAWNRAAALVLTDYGALPPHERNILRLVFKSPVLRGKAEDWLSFSRAVVAAFRADAARAGAGAQIGALVEELCAASPDFAALWQENEVNRHAEGVKRLKHPILGDFEMEYSSFAVDGRPDLSLVIYNPVDPAVAEKIRTLAASLPTKTDQERAADAPADARR